MKRPIFIGFSILLLAGCATRQQRCEEGSRLPGFNFNSVQECVADVQYRNQQNQIADAMRDQARAMKPQDKSQVCTTAPIGAGMTRIECD